jgi:uncharacterized membrane protein
MGNDNFWNTGLLGLHSLLRWLILFLLIVNIFRSYIGTEGSPYTNKDKSWNLRLLIVAHINILIGLYEYFFSPRHGLLAYLKVNSFKEIMQDSEMRFWAVEHITGMIIAIVIITISRSFAKKDMEGIKKHKKLGLFYIIALLIILLSIPWPFRFEDVPWFRGLY